MTIARLSVHKNTLHKRHRRQVSERLAREVKELRGDIDGYAIVGLRQNGTARCDWMLPKEGVSLSLLPEMVRAVMLRSIGKSDAADVVNSTFGFDDPDDAA